MNVTSLYSLPHSLTPWMMLSPICRLCGGTEHSQRIRGKSGIRGQREKRRERERGRGGWRVTKGVSRGITWAFLLLSVSAEILWLFVSVWMADLTLHLFNIVSLKYTLWALKVSNYYPGSQNREIHFTGPHVWNLFLYLAHKLFLNLLSQHIFM